MRPGSRGRRPEHAPPEESSRSPGPRHAGPTPGPSNRSLFDGPGGGLASLGQAGGMTPALPLNPSGTASEPQSHPGSPARPARTGFEPLRGIGGSPVATSWIDLAPDLTDDCRPSYSPYHDRHARPVVANLRSRGDVRLGSDWSRSDLVRHCCDSADGAAVRHHRVLRADLFAVA